MGHLTVTEQFTSVRFRFCSLAALVLFIAFHLQAQESASLRGTIRDPQGKPVAGATVQLQAKDATQPQMGHTDLQGNYSFAGLRSGVYRLRVEMSGYSDAEIPSIFLASNEVKTTDLTLVPGKSASSPSPSDQKPAFFDPPQFTVAGVTDTTSLGGHGSDTIVRSRETIAKETVSLGKPAIDAVPSTMSEMERSARHGVEREPRSFDANHRLGKVLVDDGKAREAIPFLERAQQLKPGDYENSYDLALANENAGNHERARDQAQALLTRIDKAELHHLLAESQEKSGNSLEAVREYQRAAELDPREAYLFDWGSELLLHHAPEPAMQVFRQGNRLYPASVRMLIGQGAAFFALGSYDDAERIVCAASNLNPDDPTPYLFLGKMLGAESKPSQQVVEKLRRFVTQQPENPQANYYYALALWKLREGSQDTATTKQVETLLTKAAHLDPKFAAAYLQLGILCSEQKDSPKAILNYQLAIQANPQMEAAHYRLAQAYRQTGETAKAEAEIRVYDRIVKESAQKEESERHEVRQFVYTLRDEPASPRP
jgi:tetratricopeptide (TPR) repeat protein